MILYGANCNDLYKDCATQLITKGEMVNDTLELRNAQLCLMDPTSNIVTARNLSLSYLLAEHLWYLSGNNKVDFISKFAGYWSKISDNGVTSNSAYGYLIQSAFGFDQLDAVVTQLTIDKYSRRAKININTPHVDSIATKDEPCTIALQFLIRENKLHCTAIMRSNDIWWGLPYDLAYFTTLQQIVAMRLGIEVGEYTHFATSLHAYNKDLAKLSVIGERRIEKPAPRLRVDKLLDHFDELLQICELPAEEAKVQLVSRAKELEVIA